MRRVLILSVTALLFSLAPVGAASVDAARPRQLVVDTSVHYFYGDTISVDVGSQKAARLTCYQSWSLVHEQIVAPVDGTATFVLEGWTGPEAKCVIESGAVRRDGSFRQHDASVMFTVFT